MDDAGLMCGAKRLEHLPRNLEIALDGKRAREPVPQCFSIHQLRDEVVGADIVDGADVGMIQHGDRANLAVESFAEALGRDLDRDLSMEPGIESPVDLAHAAGTQETENLVRTQSGAGRQLGGAIGALRRHVEGLILALEEPREQVFTPKYSKW